MANRIILTGQKFGRLLVLSPVKSNQSKHLFWLCQCDCGNLAKVEGHKLRSGHTRSCGCLLSEVTTKRSTKHNGVHDGTGLYFTWNGIMNRCLNKNSGPYPSYGGRGIGIFLEWKQDYNAFRDYILETLGPKPSPEYSIDRINNDGNYEPGNLRWATRLEQAHNTRPYLKRHKENN